METIQIEALPELTQSIAGDRGRRNRAAMIPSALSERAKIEEILAASGLLVKLDASLAARYQGGVGRPRRTPVYVRGKPLSEVIATDRECIRQLLSG